MRNFKGDLVREQRLIELRQSGFQTILKSRHTTVDSLETEDEWLWNVRYLECSTTVCRFVIRKIYTCITALHSFSSLFSLLALAPLVEIMWTSFLSLVCKIFNLFRTELDPQFLCYQTLVILHRWGVAYLHVLLFILNF